LTVSMALFHVILHTTVKTPVSCCEKQN
jgi:hypothetical protein